MDKVSLGSGSMGEKLIYIFLGIYCLSYYRAPQISHAQVGVFIWKQNVNINED